MCALAEYVRWMIDDMRFDIFFRLGNHIESVLPSITLLNEVTYDAKQHVVQVYMSSKRNVKALVLLGVFAKHGWLKQIVIFLHNTRARLIQYNIGTLKQLFMCIAESPKRTEREEKLVAGLITSNLMEYVVPYFCVHGWNHTLHHLIHTYNNRWINLFQAWPNNTPTHVLFDLMSQVNPKELFKTKFEYLYVFNSPLTPPQIKTYLQLVYPTFYNDYNILGRIAEKEQSIERYREVDCSFVCIIHEKMWNSAKDHEKEKILKGLKERPDLLMYCCEEVRSHSSFV